MPTLTDVVMEGTQPGCPMFSWICHPDDPLQTGRAGAVFACTALDSIDELRSFVVKIYHDDETGKACAASAGKLLHALPGIDRRRFEQDRLNIGSLPGLVSLPLCVFRASTEDGRTVMAILMYHLGALGFKHLTDVLPDLSDELPGPPSVVRLSFVRTLAASVTALGEIGFVHRDINRPNLMANVNTGVVAVLDFDGGAFIGSSAPMQGKHDDWLPPELYPPADPMPRLESDAWSLAIGIAEILYGFLPYTYLSQTHPESVRRSLRQTNCQWPPPEGHMAVSLDRESEASRIRLTMTGTAASVRYAMESTFGSGYDTLKDRATAHDWLVALSDVDSPPIVRTAGISHLVPMVGECVYIFWNVENVDTIHLEFGGAPAISGPVQRRNVTGMTHLPMSFTEYTTVKLVAQNANGETQVDLPPVYPTQRETVAPTDSPGSAVGTSSMGAGFPRDLVQLARFDRSQLPRLRSKRPPRP